MCAIHVSKGLRVTGQTRHTEPPTGRETFEKLNFHYIILHSSTFIFTILLSSSHLFSLTNGTTELFTVTSNSNDNTLVLQYLLMNGTDERLQTTVIENIDFTNHDFHHIAMAVHGVQLTVIVDRVFRLHRALPFRVAVRAENIFIGTLNDGETADFQGIAYSYTSFVYVCMYICMYVYAFVCMCMYIRVCAYACLQVCMHLCMCVRASLYTCVSTCVYVHTHNQYNNNYVIIVWSFSCM